MNSEEITILIERYLDGELSEQEKLQFELDIKTNKELANDLLLHKEIRKALADEEIIDLREKLNNISDKFHEKERKTKKKKQFAIYLSSSLIVISLITSFYIYDKKYTNDELYNMYYEHYDAGTITRGEIKSSKEIYTNALRTYDIGKYVDAIKLFEQISDSSEYYISKEYFTGLSYMELLNFEKAIIHFEPLLDNNESIYYENIIWFTGLCYLKTNQNEKAKQQFTKLLDKNSGFQKNSKEILEKIK
ncbi:MAG: hypothetical protein A2046_05950 [Bacteroidetes bacterium GWA2_30_7]|nr:MAG: hypothetical protein A2046_05950 [Bacteroidetes bacterium GWA2_30_7]